MNQNIVFLLATNFKVQAGVQDDIPSLEPGRVSKAKTFTLHNIGNGTDVPTCGAILITSKVPLCN